MAVPRKAFCWPQYFPTLLMAVAAVLQSPVRTGAIDPQPSAVDDHIRAASWLSSLDTDTIPSPGIPIGITTYDVQHVYSQGHQIGKNTGADVVHFVWTFWDVIPTDPVEIDRFVNYNSYTLSTGTLNQRFSGTTISLGSWSRAGSPRLDVDGANCAHVALHQWPEPEWGYRAWHLRLPIEGDDSVESTMLATPDPYFEDENLWVDVAVEQNAGTKDADTDIYHVIAAGCIYFHGGFCDPSDRIWYWRYDAGAATPDWQGPVLIDSSRNVSWVIDADDNSDRVAIAYTSDYETDWFNGVNNVAYRESQTSGMGWLTGFELGEINKNFASSYSDPFGPQAWPQVSIAYDHSGDLHIVWVEQRESESEHAAIKHWCQSPGTDRTVARGYYDSDAFWDQSLNLGQVTLGIGDGSTLCQGGLESNQDYLYVVYMKLGGETSEEEADVSSRGFANGELYLTGSRDNGLTWSWPANLTNTKTPGCHSDDADSLCASEAWASIAREVDDIHIFYIRDYEANWLYETGWTINDAMYLRLPGGTTDAPYLCPPIAPNLSVDLTADPACEYHAAPGDMTQETLTIGNLGNGPLAGEVSVLPGAAWLSVVGAGAFAIPEAGADIAFPVVMDAGVLSSGVYTGTIRVTHDDITKANPLDLPVEFFVFDGVFCSEQNVLKTAVASPGVLSLQVGTDGRLGAPDPEAGLWRFLDSSSAICDATLLVAHGSQDPDTVVFHRFYGRDDPGQHGFRALVPLAIDTTAYGTDAGYAKATAMMSTADSVLGVTATWFFPQQHDSADFVIVRYTVLNRTLSPVADIAVAAYADLNVLAGAHMRLVQDDVGNHGNYVLAQNLIYQYGYDTIGHVPSGPLNSSQRYSGGFTYIAGRDALGNPFSLETAALRGAVGDNRVNTDDDGPTSGFLYRTIVGPPGIAVWEPMAHEDSAKDMYTWLTLDQGLTLAPGEKQSYVIGIVSDTLGHELYNPGTSALTDGLGAATLKAWAWADGHVLCRCSCHGDPECDGVANVLDVVQTVDVAFRSGAPTFDDNCPDERTDVDCSGFTNVLDVVRFVNVAFRDGDPATEFCDPCGL